MINRVFGVASFLWLCLVVSGAFAQDPFKLAPGAYKLQFENDWVKVARVHYGPKEKIAAHDHPRAGTVFVYLNDGGPVRFQHVHAGDPPFPLIRPATQAGAFRLARGVTEHHEVENLSELSNDFLRVELKTDPVEPETFHGRFPPDLAEKSSQKVAFENGQVRIGRIACAARESCDIASSPSSPALLIAFGPARATVISKEGHAAQAEMGLGATQWLEPGQKAMLENRGIVAVRELRIDFKTRPVKADEGERDE